METWFKTGGYGDKKIEAVQVERSTDKSVWYKETNWNGSSKISQTRIKSDYYNFFKTFEEAKDFLVKKAERKHENAKRNLDSARSELEEMKALKP